MSVFYEVKGAYGFASSERAVFTTMREAKAFGLEHFFGGFEVQRLDISVNAETILAILNGMPYVNDMRIVYRQGERY